jgi:4-hydroxy-tetrahydrodipicolinate reductase
LRLVVWGPGGLGKICIREITGLDEFELVGVLAYSAEKDGVDAGTLAGIDPVGVTASIDVDEVLAIDCDCVLHVARDHGDYGSVDDLVRILAAGRNLITVHPYHHLEHMDKTTAPAGTAEKLIAAAERGGATFHSTGIHPEFVCDRIAAAMTGLCTGIESIKIDENWDVSFVSFEHLSMLGYGHPPEHAREISPAAIFATNYCMQNLHGMAGCVGVTLARTEVEEDYVPAEVDIDLPNIFIKQGTVGRLTHRYTGYVNDPDEKPFVTIEVNWMMGRTEMLPDGAHPDDYYVVSIEGHPSVKIGLDIKDSIKTGSRLMVADDPTSEPGYYATIATVLQAVPRVVAAGPGVLKVSSQELHWAPDLRTLASNPATPTGASV